MGDLHLGADAFEDLGIDGVGALAAKHFAAEFQDDAFVFYGGGRRTVAHVARGSGAGAGWSSARAAGSWQGRRRAVYFQKVGFNPIVPGSESVCNRGAPRAIIGTTCRLHFMTAATSPSKKNAMAVLAPGYRAALSAHLKARTATRGVAARAQGRLALAHGLLSRDLVVVHERALTALLASGDFDGTSRRSLNRAGRFLAFALAPMEAVLRATRESNRHLRERNETLRLHALALARGKRRLQGEVARREAGEAVIRGAKERYRRLFLESQIMQKKLRQLTRQILSAQEEERKRISRELHDEVVQTLVGINVELSALGRGVETGLRTFKATLGRTQRLVENSVNAVHRFARELRPAVLDDLGLIPALHAFSRNLAARGKLKIHITAFRGVETLPAAKRTVLFRVAQEALANVVRHARATRATLSLVQIPGAIRMEISDNGRSFAVEKVLGAPNPKRLGLVGMRERVEMIGGRFTLRSAPGEGTAVCAEIPFRVAKTNPS